MSQVRKFQEGGIFKKNGKQLTGQQAIDRILEVSAGAPTDTREALTVAAKAVQDGNVVDYDQISNSFTIYDKSGNDITKNYTNVNADTGDTGIKKVWDATWNNRPHRFKESMKYLAQVNVGNETNSSNADKLLRRGYEWFDYDTDGDVKKYRESGAKNIDRMRVLEGIKEYLSHGIDQSKYNTNDWNGNDLTILKNYAEESRKEGFWENLYDAIRNDKLNDSQIEFLRLAGFNKDFKSGDSTDGSNKYTVPEGWKGSKEAAAKAKVSIKKLNDGHYYITDNDDFTTQNWYTGGLDFLTGTPFENGFIADNGRLWTADEAYASKSPIFAPWFSAVENTANQDYWAGYNARVGSNFRFIGDRTGKDSNYYGAYGTTAIPEGGYSEFRYNPDVVYSPEWHDWFSKMGIRDYATADLTGKFSNIGNKKVISYIDPNRRNSAGMWMPYFVVYDPSQKDNPYKSFNDEASMINAYSLTPLTYGGTSEFSGNNWQPIGKKSYAVHYEFGPVGQRNTILRGKDGNYYISRKNAEGGLERPAKIKNLNLLYDLINNYAKYEKEYKDNWNDLRDLLTRTDISELPQEQRITWEQAIVGPNGERGFWFKEGGSIEKFQYGGVADTATTTVKSKSAEEGGADFSKAHALDGSDGGLTNAEVMQIASAFGDLAGVGLAFVPGANVASAVTGAAASTTRFAADIKQDGFQGKDLWNWLGNLTLDAATILPILGSGAKALKVVKVIKGVGKPLVKFLSLTGAAAPVITAVTKIANGEKYTSADLAQAIQGIGAAAIGIKSIKGGIGNAKLAAKVASGEVKNAKVELNGVQKSAKEVATAIDGKSKSEAVKKVKELFANGNTEISGKQASDFLTEIGATHEKGKIQFSWNPKKWGKIAKGETRGDSTISFKPNEEKAHSALRYYFDPFTRAKVLGSDAVFGFGKQRGLLDSGTSKKLFTRAAARAKSKKHLNLTDQAVLEMSSYNPQAFGRNYFRPEGLEGGMWIGNADRREFTPVQLSDKITFGGLRYRNYSIPTTRNFILGESGPLITPRRYKTPNANVQQILALPSHTPGFKSGGKIAKFSIGGDTGKGVKVNWANVDDLLRAGVSIGGILKDKQLKETALDDLRTRQHLTPHLSRAKYYFGDINASAEAQKEPFLQMEYVTNDPYQQLSSELTKAQNLSNIEANRNAAISQKIAQTDDYNRQQSDKEEVAALAKAEERSKYFSELNYQEDALKSEALNRIFANVINPLGQQFSQQGRDSQEKLADLMYNKDMVDLDLKRQNRIKTALISGNYKSQWDALSQADKNLYSNDIELWMMSKYPDAYKSIYAKTDLDRQNEYDLAKRYASSGGPRILYNKRGGYIRPAQEQIAIDSAKAAKRSVDKLSDNLAKLLQQLLRK